MLKHFRGFVLIVAIAMLGIAQPLASAWACDPCPKPRPDYTIEAPETPPERP